jgi:hypothetical protein
MIDLDFHHLPSYELRAWQATVLDSSMIEQPPSF